MWSVPYYPDSIEAAEDASDRDGAVSGDSESDNSTASVSFDHGQIEALLGSMGGMAPLDDFMRQFAKTKGFRRLGKNVRRGLESELETPMHAGKIVMDRGAIWIKQ